VAIYFPCLCGQPLRVDEERAGTHTRCPACDRLTRAPSLERSNTALGIAPAEDLPEPIAVLPPVPAAEVPEPSAFVPPIPAVRLIVVEETSSPPRPAPPPVADEPPVYPLGGNDREDEAARQRERQRAAQWLARAEKQLTKRRLPALAWPLEKNWCECLLYPMRSWPVVLLLALGWATLTAITVTLLPRRWELDDVGGGIMLLFLVFLLLGYTVAWLQTTLTAAIEGRVGFVFRPGNALLQTFRSGAEAVWCFLAGPMVLAIAAFLFWLNSGDLAIVDHLILWELEIVAVGYWALAMMAVWESERFRAANPVAVAELVKNSGYCVPLTALLAALVVVSHSLLMVGAVQELHRSALGWFWLVGLWVSQLCGLLFLLRWLGVSRFRAWKAQQRSREVAESAEEEPAATAPIRPSTGKRKIREEGQPPALASEG
jgi:hypothetical protein